MDIIFPHLRNLKFDCASPQNLELEFMRKEWLLTQLTQWCLVGRCTSRPSIPLISTVSDCIEWSETTIASFRGMWRILGFSRRQNYESVFQFRVKWKSFSGWSWQLFMRSSTAAVRLWDEASMIAADLVLQAPSIDTKRMALSFRWTIAVHFNVGSDSWWFSVILKPLVLPSSRPRDSRIEVFWLIFVFVSIVSRNLDGNPDMRELCPGLQSHCTVRTKKPWQHPHKRPSDNGFSVVERLREWTSLRHPQTHDP